MLKVFFAIFLLIPLPVMAYHTETQTPYGITNTLNNDGSITVSWQESDGYEDNPPEYYIVYIGLTETADDKSVQTKFGFTEALSWQSYTFTAEYLYNELSVDNQKIYAKVKAFHDTNGTTSDFTPVESVLYDYVYIPTTTTSSTTTTTTTLPKAEDVVEDGVTTYLAWDKDGCEHPGNPLSYKEYLTAVESKEWFGYQNGDCSGPTQEELDAIKAEEEAKAQQELEDKLKAEEEERLRLEEEAKLEAERIAAELKAQEEADALAELEKIDIDLPEEDIEEFVEVIKEVEEFVETLVIEIDIVEIPEDIIIVIEEEVIEDELDKEIPGDDPIREDELQNEEILVEPIQEIIEEKPVEEYTEEEIEIVQEVVDNAISNVEELTEEQVEVVAEVLQVATEDVKIIAEAVKTDEVVAEAVEIFVERAVENADVENYTLADVVTEIQYEAFLENPIEVFVDLDFEEINFTTIGNDMTQDQREKAQEVVVPVILTRIVSIAGFAMRKSL
jgi:hypothetical protein